jgi:calcium-dependent protein kinase
MARLGEGAGRGGEPLLLTKPKLRRDNRHSKRCSIDVGNYMEFQSTIRDFVVTEKNMCESYGRIEINQEKFIHLRKEDIKKFYKFEEIIGEGAFGSVYRALCLKSREPRAVKIIKKEGLGQSKKNEVFAELELLKKMDHPNIIKLYEVFESQQRFQVVTELCKGGSIIDFIKSRKYFDENIVKVILKQLLGCLNYLHTHKIVHRDIKLENVVFISKVS